MTATGTGAGELRTRLAKALHTCFCERHRIPVEGYGDDGSMILEENGWLDQADAALAAIAEAGLAPAGGTLTAEEREAIAAGADALVTELGHAQDNYARARMGGDPELLAEYEERCNRIGPQVATLKAIVERGAGDMGE